MLREMTFAFLYHSIVSFNQLGSTGRVAAVGKDGLPGDPGSVSTQELDDRRDILHHGQTAAHAVGLVEFDSLGRLLGIEEGCCC